MAGESDRPQNKPDSPQARILIAEDYPENRILLEIFLQDLPYTLFFAEDGYQAISQWRTHDPDLILMDVQMPGLDGLEATARIRAEFGRHVPIIALTADTQTSTRQHCLDAGCDLVLTKPIDHERLLLVLDDYLSRSTVRAQASGIRPEIVTLLPMFLKNREAEPAALRLALQQNDTEKIARLGHGLKGVGGTFGFPELSEIGERIEIAVAAGKAQVVADLADELSRELAGIRARAMRAGLL